jgi:hypothetical protein
MNNTMSLLQFKLIITMLCYLAMVVGNNAINSLTLILVREGMKNFRPVVFLH